MDFDPKTVGVCAGREVCRVGAMSADLINDRFLYPRDFRGIVSGDFAEA
jgi:hypothetical protein